jgi:negative regulator of sigma E activity
VCVCVCVCVCARTCVCVCVCEDVSYMGTAQQQNKSPQVGTLSLQGKQRAMHVTHQNDECTSHINKVQ